MHEEEWGHFVDLEMNQTEREKKIKKKIEPQQKKTQVVKTSKNFTVIYEEDIWHKRDDTDDSDYYIKEGLSEVVPYFEELKKEPRKKEPRKEEPRKKELRKEDASYINKITTILYCVICASFISWSILI